MTQSDNRVSNCDGSPADAFLKSKNDSLEDPEFILHLDNCGECREHLEQHTATPDLWNQLSTLLKPDPYDQAGRNEYSAATIGEIGTGPGAASEVLSSLAPTDDPHHLGRLGTYGVTGVVGVGGMGVVLKAVDPSLDRVVAIKVMAPRLAHHEKARLRFAREAKAAAAVLHPNVIPIHSVSSGTPLPYLVMAFVRGGSLQKRIDAEGALPTVEVLRIGSQVAAGLAAAHDQGLVHRDIKPENILLEEGVERVALTDFGLARAVDDNSVTQQGTIAGTPMYMSPEQASGEKVDQLSDLFSLGSVLYAMCTGKPPYRADTSFAVMRRIIDDEPQPIHEVNPNIPPWLANIVAKLMAKSKSGRFQSIGEVQHLLEKCLSHVQQPDAIPLPHIPGLPKQQSATPVKQKYAVAAVAFLAVATVIWSFSPWIASRFAAVVTNRNDRRPSHEKAQESTPSADALADPAKREANNANAASPENPNPFRYDLRFVPSEVTLVSGFRPELLHSEPRFRQLRKTILANPAWEFACDQDVRQVLSLQLPQGQRPFGNHVLLITVANRSAADFAENQFGTRIQSQNRGDNRTLHPASQAGWAYRIIDEHTVVFGRRTTLELHRELLENQPISPRFLIAIASIQHGPAFAMANTREIGPLESARQNIPANPFGGFMLGFAPIWDSTDYLTLSVSADESATLKLSAHGADQARFQAAAETLQGIPVMAASILKRLSQRSSSSIPPSFARLDVAESIVTALGMASFQQTSDKEFALSIPLNEAQEPVLNAASSALNRFMNPSQAAFQATSKNNLALMAMAFRRFEAKHGFRPTARTMLPGAKHPVSWRVAILPFMNRRELFERYDTDQPWDSETNRKLLDKMPPIYRHPSQPQNSTSTCYATVVSDENSTSPTENTKGPQSEHSLSILVLEVKTDIPWTCPQDIDVSSAKSIDLPMLSPRGWQANFSDGSIRLIAEDTSPKQLESWIPISNAE